jgi:hypothetical protein
MCKVTEYYSYLFIDEQFTRTDDASKVHDSDHGKEYDTLVVGKACKIKVDM